MSGRRGFTLLEVIVASLIMGIAVAGILSGLSTAARNAARLSQSDRAVLFARSKMDEIVSDLKLPRYTPLQGSFDKKAAGGVDAGWTARITAFETVPNPSPGLWSFDRVQLEVWWMDGKTRRTFAMDGYRRSFLRPEDFDGPNLKK